MPVVQLAKDCVDVGCYTDRYDDLRRFYVDELGLPYEHLLKIGAGVHQHRLGLRGSVLTLNSSRRPLDAAPTAFVRLDVHADERRSLHDPDGTEVVLTPDVEAIAVHWASSDPDRLGRLLGEGFGAVDEGGGTWRLGTTRLVLRPGGGPVGPMRSRGLRYLTVQVHDVRAAHQHLCSVGWSESMAPTRLGDTACISFVLDPDGAPVEVSQRASLTGPLPEL